MYIATVFVRVDADGVSVARIIGLRDERRDWPFIDETQTALFKAPVRTAL